MLMPLRLLAAPQTEQAAEHRLVRAESLATRHDLPDQGRRSCTISGTFDVYFTRAGSGVAEA
eukprot:3794571-Amphidinium_carterae.1